MHWARDQGLAGRQQNGVRESIRRTRDRCQLSDNGGEANGGPGGVSNAEDKAAQGKPSEVSKRRRR